MIDRPPLSLTRLLVFVLLMMLLVFGSLELGLRLAGCVYLKSNEASQGSEPQADSLELWALGDSYTFGIGSDTPSTDSYPAVTARLLEARTGRPVVLRNLARPGQNSSQVVASFRKELLARAIPDVVLMMAGVNNIRWLGQSGQFCMEELSGRGIRPPKMEWLRTLRSYKVLRHLVLSVRPARAQDRSCALVATGFEFLDKGSPMLASEAFASALSFNKRSAWAHLGRGLSLLRQGRQSAAIDDLYAAQALGLNPPALTLALGFAIRAVRPEEARVFEVQQTGEPVHRDMTSLLSGWKQYDAGELEAALVTFEGLCGTEGERAQMLRGAVVAYAHDGRGWTLRAMGRSEESSAAFELANELGREMFIVPHHLGWSHLGLALKDLDLASRDRSVLAVARGVEGWARAGSAGKGCAAAHQPFVDALSYERQQPQAMAGQRRCARLGPDGHLPPMSATEGMPTVRPMVTVSVQEWIDPGDTRLVEQDIETAQQLASAAGTQLVLLTYPEPDAHPELARAIVRSGTKLGVLVVDPAEQVREAVANGVPWSQLRVPDGHPTTRGYRIVASQLVDELLEFSPNLQEGP